MNAITSKNASSNSDEKRMMGRQMSNSQFGFKNTSTPKFSSNSSNAFMEMGKLPSYDNMAPSGLIPLASEFSYNFKQPGQTSSSSSVPN